jgi:hypothetical protein
MGFASYFGGLIFSGAIALVIRALVRRFTKSWQPTRAIGWRNLLQTLLRAFPFAFAFAPTLLMKRGLGVLIPASLYLFPEIGALPFQSEPLDADDKHNIVIATISFFAVWVLVAFIFFVRQSATIDRKIENEPRA